ncbi:MAG: S8 family peptidase [Planctomycetota bacterium]
MLLAAPVAHAQGRAKAKAGKVNCALWCLGEQYQKDGPKILDGRCYSNSPLFRICRDADGDRVIIDAVAQGDAKKLLADLKELGLKRGCACGGFVSGELPVSSIARLRDLKSLRAVLPAAAMTRAGLTTSGGDPAMNTDKVRNLFKLTGEGVRVGALSDTYDNALQNYFGTGAPPLTDAAKDVLNGDLPSGVIVLEEGVSPGIDEGRAMLQLIHDVAPGAELAFHSAFNGLANFANGILELRSDAKCDVIVDDVIYFAEPMFMDGLIAQAADKVKKKGAAYFSSAGNGARKGYESFYRSSGTKGLTGTRHDFDPSAGVDGLQTWTIPAGGQVIWSFQWNEPFASVTGNNKGAKTDLDFFVLDMAGNPLPPPGAGPGLYAFQGGWDNLASGDPVELILVVNLTGAPAKFQVSIEHAKGPKPDFMKYVWFTSGPPGAPSEYDTKSGTIFGHAAANGAMAIGAARYIFTPRFGFDPALPEFFTSAGPVQIFFDRHGKSSGEIRKKPDVVGPDGGNTTFFVPVSPDLEGDGFPNFFGTSASAPHVAALAALMIEQHRLLKANRNASKGRGFGPMMKVDTLYGILKSTALDMDDPFTPEFDAGFDVLTGYGYVDGVEAVLAVTGK